MTVPDGSWDLLVVKKENHTEIILTGAITRPIPLEFAPGTEVMNISFDPAVFLPELPSPQRLNKGISLPVVGRNKFRFGSNVLEIPTFDNAEIFVEKMQHFGLLGNDKLVASVLQGQPMAASERSIQRHFQYATGLTYKYFEQIKRAEKALSLLQQGMPALQVALAVGYSDQPHMINSLKRLMGKTPKDIQSDPDTS